MHNNKKRQTQNPHNQWEAHQTAYQQPQNHRLRTDSSLSHRGINACYWYQIFALDSAAVITQTCLARMKASFLIQYIITEKQSNQINTLYGETKKMAHDSQIVKLSYDGPSHGQASDTNQRIKDLLQGRH